MIKTTLAVLLFTLIVCGWSHNLHDLHDEPHLPHHHNCQHDEFMKSVKVVSFEQEPSPIEATLHHEQKLRREHKGTWAPIRVLADYSNMQTTSAFQAFIQNKLVPSTLGFVSQAYTVFPKSLISEVQGQSQCGDFTIPLKHQRMGVPNYDLVLYIGVLNAQGQDWLARAAPCILDKQTQRPVAGMVQFNTYYLSQLNLNNPADTHWYSWIQTTIHECTHVLGFSSSMFQYYINPQTNKPLGASNVAKTAYSRSWITLPNVVKQAQTYYNCPSAWGAPLENNGGAGTAGSHWERTTFGNEAMTGSDFPGAVFSVFTFKLLEGSGWYLPNYNYAQPFVWGMNEGCPIEQGQCPSGTAEFCSSTQDLCSVDYMGTAHCANDDDLAGGCSYWEEYGNMDCRSHSNNIDYITKYTGGYVGAGSRCWVTTLATKVGFQNVFTSCYDSHCINGNQIQVTIGTNKYLCTSDGQVLTVKYQQYTATITCPPINRFCLYENQCPGDCSGRGTCRDTVCQCWAGFTGSDCSQQA